MVTKQPLYLEDSYLKKWEAEVKEVNEGKYVVLDQTAFYPKSGGQPCDKGVIKRKDQKFNVIFVGKFSGQLSHEVDRKGLEPGDEVQCKIDWKRRYTFMRYHTASHVLSGVINKKTGAMITGNQIGLDRTRVDFSLDEFNKEEIRGYEPEVNRIIEKGLPVKFETMSRKEVMKDPDLVKLAKGLPQSIKKLRIVNIEGFDRQPCGGTHVKNTEEIGKLKITDMANKGKDNRRVYFVLED